MGTHLTMNASAFSRTRCLVAINFQAVVVLETQRTVHLKISFWIETCILETSISLRVGVQECNIKKTGLKQANTSMSHDSLFQTIFVRLGSFLHVQGWRN